MLTTRIIAGLAWCNELSARLSQAYSGAVDGHHQYFVYDIAFLWLRSRSSLAFLSDCRAMLASVSDNIYDGPPSNDGWDNHCLSAHELAIYVALRFSDLMKKYRTDELNGEEARTFKFNDPGRGRYRDVVWLAEHYLTCWETPNEFGHTCWSKEDFSKTTGKFYGIEVTGRAASKFISFLEEWDPARLNALVRRESSILMGRYTASPSEAQRLIREAQRKYQGGELWDWPDQFAPRDHGHGSATTNAVDPSEPNTSETGQRSAKVRWTIFRAPAVWRNVFASANGGRHLTERTWSNWRRGRLSRYVGPESTIDRVHFDGACPFLPSDYDDLTEYVAAPPDRRRRKEAETSGNGRKVGRQVSPLKQ